MTTANLKNTTNEMTKALNNFNANQTEAHKKALIDSVKKVNADILKNQATALISDVKNGTKSVLDAIQTNFDVFAIQYKKSEDGIINGAEFTLKTYLLSVPELEHYSGKYIGDRVYTAVLGHLYANCVTNFLTEVDDAKAKKSGENVFAFVPASKKVPTLNTADFAKYNCAKGNSSKTKIKAQLQAVVDLMGIENVKVRSVDVNYIIAKSVAITNDTAKKDGGYIVRGTIKDGSHTIKKVSSAFVKTVATAIIKASKGEKYEVVEK